MDSNCDDKIHEPEGYTSGDLSWLEHQFRPRHAISAASAQVSSRTDYSASDAQINVCSLAALFAGNGLTQVVPDAEKLRRVRARREIYLASRNQEDVLDLLLRLRSKGSTFSHIRLVESKGLSYWYRESEEDYKENWFLHSSPMRRYYDKLGENALIAETQVDRLDDHLLALAGPININGQPRKRRTRTG